MRTTGGAAMPSRQGEGERGTCASAHVHSPLRLRCGRGRDRGQGGQGRGCMRAPRRASAHLQILAVKLERHVVDAVHLLR